MPESSPVQFRLKKVEQLENDGVRLLYTVTRQFVTEKGLQLPDGLSNNAYFDHVAQQVNLTPNELTNLLWNEYSPSDIWMVILAIGLGTTLLLYIYDRVINKTKR